MEICGEHGEDIAYAGRYCPACSEVDDIKVDHKEEIIELQDEHDDEISSMREDFESQIDDLQDKIEELEDK